MGIKSTWAYLNAGRTMREALSSGKAKEKNGFVLARGRNVYAENKNGKLIAKTYSNRTQAEKKISSLKEENIICEISNSHPFLICLIEN